MNFNELSKQIHKQNWEKGWWDNPNRCIYECIQLVSTEIAEATEGERKNLMDDHLTHRKMGEVELADALIRFLDLGCKLECEHITIDRSSSGVDLDLIKMKTIAAKHHLLNKMLCRFSNYLETDFQCFINNSYSIFIDTLMEIGKQQGYDIEGAVAEKLEYNKTRPDHARENRAKENGKKF